MKKKTKTQPVKCVQEARQYPPDSFSLPTDGRKSRHVRVQRKTLFMEYSTYANGDGTNMAEGIARAAAAWGWSRRTVNRLNADLKQLGCLTDDIGADGKVKLYGPRGTKMRKLAPSALPLPGSTPWVPIETENGPAMHRLVATGIRATFENGVPTFEGLDDELAAAGLDVHGSLVNAGAPNSDAGAPNSDAGAPNSDAGAPNSDAGAPNRGLSGPRITGFTEETATTATTGNITAGVVGDDSPEAGRQRASGIIQALSEALGETVAVAKGHREQLAALSLGVNGSEARMVIKGWVSTRDLTKMKMPLYKFIEEFPQQLALVRAATKAAEPPKYTPEQDAEYHKALAKENGFDTWEEFTAYADSIEQEVKAQMETEARGETINHDNDPIG